MVKYSNIDNIFSSLSDTTRRDILVKISEGSLDLRAIAKTHKISLPAVSKHLRVLENARLIKREKSGRAYNFSLLEAAEYWIKQFKALEKFLKEDK